jgi:hypothetical protein
MPGDQQIPECTQKHHRTTMREELFLTLYNATLFKFHSICCSICFTLPQCSENIHLISKFLSQNTLFCPSRVSYHILELIQIFVTKMQYILLYRCSQKADRPHIQVDYQKFSGSLFVRLSLFFSVSSANTKPLLL